MKRPKIGVIIACAVAGGIFGFFGAMLLDGQLALGDGANLPLLLLGALFLVLGMLNLAFSTSRRSVAAAMALDTTDTDDVEPERRFFRLQGVVLVLGGAAMLLPGIGREPLGLDGRTALAIVLALLVAESAINWRIWRISDELIRRMQGEICAVAFWAFQLILFVWAMTVQFGVIARFDPLDVVALMMAIYIVAAGVIGARRGFG